MGKKEKRMSSNRSRKQPHYPENVYTSFSPVRSTWPSRLFSALSIPLSIFPPGYVHVVFPRDFHVLVSVGFGWNRERRRHRRQRTEREETPSLRRDEDREIASKGRVGGEERERGGWKEKRGRTSAKFHPNWGGTTTTTTTTRTMTTGARG